MKRIKKYFGSKFNFDDEAIDAKRQHLDEKRLDDANANYAAVLEEAARLENLAKTLEKSKTDPKELDKLVKTQEDEVKGLEEALKVAKEKLAGTKKAREGNAALIKQINDSKQQAAYLRTNAPIEYKKATKPVTADEAHDDLRYKVGSDVFNAAAAVLVVVFASAMYFISRYSTSENDKKIEPKTITTNGDKKPDIPLARPSKETVPKLTNPPSSYLIIINDEANSKFLNDLRKSENYPSGIFKDNSDDAKNTVEYFFTKKFKPVNTPDSDALTLAQYLQYKNNPSSENKIPESWNGLISQKQEKAFLSTIVTLLSGEAKDRFFEVMNYSSGKVNNDLFNAVKAATGKTSANIGLDDVLETFNQANFQAQILQQRTNSR